MLLTNTVEYFDESILQNIVRECIQVLDYNFHLKKSELLTEAENILVNVCKEIGKIQKENRLNRISYLHISWLRNPFLFQKNVTYDFFCYGKKWYSDEMNIEIQKDFLFLKEFLENFQERILLVIQQTRKYELKSYLDFFTGKYYELFQLYVAALFQKVFQEHNELLLSYFDANESFYVLIGDYKGKVDIVYHQEELLPYESLILDDLTTIFEDQLTVNGYELINQDYSNQLIHCINAIETNFSGSSFRNVILEQSNFKSANFSRSDFSYAKLKDINFSYANCSYAQFKSVNGSIASSTDMFPSYFGLDFSYANLDFADFTGSQMRGAKFLEASMKRTKFPKSMREECSLSEKQKNEIEWVSE